MSHINLVESLLSGLKRYLWGHYLLQPSGESETNGTPLAANGQCSKQLNELFGKHFEH